jgi:YD repeat-containing protein
MVYDNYYDRITERKQSGDTFKYKYDVEGRLSSVVDSVNATTTKYEYDFSGRPVSQKSTNGLSLSLKYDTKNRLESYTANFAGTSASAHTTGFRYGNTAVGSQKPGLLYGVSYNGAERVTYAYDSLARLSQKTLPTAGNYQTTYTYLAGIQAGSTTGLPSSLKYGKVSGTNTTLNYTYDAMGNIKTIKEGTALKVTYTYDGLGQLKT